MRASRFAAAFLFLLAPLLTVFPCPSEASMVDMSDGEDDVMLHGYRTVQTGDHPEIDILSLSSSASLQSITIELTMDDDVTDGFGYTYSITASGVNVVYQEGMFMAWRWVGEAQELDNVQTGVNGPVITAIVPRTLIGSELVLNATNQYLPPADPDTEGPETYFDKAGEMEGGGGSPGVGGFEKDIDDESGDVALRYWAVSPTDDENLDITAFRMEHISGAVKFELTLAGKVEDHPKVNYTLYGGGMEVRYTNGEGFRMVGGAEYRIDDVVVEDGRLEIEVETDSDESSVGLAFAAAIRLTGGGSFIIDTVPEDPYSSTELLPFAPGNSEKVVIEVASEDSAVMRRTFSGFTADGSFSIRSAADSDRDGSVSEVEAVDLFRETFQEVRTGHGTAVKMDGRTGELVLDLDTLGLTGAVGSADDIEITWTLNYSFSVPVEGSHTFEVDYPADPLPGMGAGDRTDPERELELRIILGEGLRFHPLTLRPEELANSMNVDADRIEYAVSGEEVDDFHLGELRFDFSRDAERDDDDDAASVDGEDEELWPFILILMAMIAVMVGIYIWSRTRET